MTPFKKNEHFGRGRNALMVVHDEQTAHLIEERIR